MPLDLSAKEQIVVVINVESEVQSISKRELIDIYMGALATLNSGKQVTPLDAAQGSSLRKAFYQRLLGKSEAQVNSYWARLMFSARSKPPTKIKTPTVLLKQIAASDNKIGYLYASDINANFKVIHDLK